MDDFFNDIPITPSFDPFKVNKSEIDLVLAYLKKILGKKDLYSTHGYLRELEKIFYCINDLENSACEDLFAEEGFPKSAISRNDPKYWLIEQGVEVGRYRKVYIARLIIGILIACQNESHIFYKAISEGPTKNGYYINKIMTSGIPFFLLTTSSPSGINEKGDYVYSNLDFNDFVLHPCSASKQNWLYLKNEYNLKYKCKKCGKSFHTNNANIIIADLQPFESLSVKIKTQLSAEDFKVYFNNCIEYYKESIPENFRNEKNVAEW